MTWEKFKKYVYGARDSKAILPFTSQQEFPFGIFSLCEEPNNILMWSHYSDHYTGICIAFEINWNCINKHLDENSTQEGFRFSLPGMPPSQDTLKFGLQEVKYSETINECSANEFFRSHFDSKMEDKVSCEVAKTKFNNWSYEKEWRLICFNQHSRNDNDLFNLTTLKFIKPCAIILGKRMPGEIEKTIRENCAEYPILNSQPCYDQNSGIMQYSMWPNKDDLEKEVLLHKNRNLEPA